MNLPPPAGPRTLVAGIGNIFLRDDGFGVETARLLTERQLPEHVEVVDIGVRGVHLAYQLLDGYDTLVLVDATARGEAPGTLYLIEHDVGGESPSPVAPALDGHRMTPDTVLALLATLCAGDRRRTTTPRPGRRLRTGLGGRGHRSDRAGVRRRTGGRPADRRTAAGRRAVRGTGLDRRGFNR